MPESDPSLISDPAPLLPTAPPACHHGAVSSRGAAAAVTAAAPRPTGATAGAHRGTQSLVPTVAAGVGAL